MLCQGIRRKEVFHVQTAEMLMKPFEPIEDYVYVTQYRHPKTGRIIRARDYGKKAFRFPVKRKPIQQ